MKTGRFHAPESTFENSYQSQTSDLANFLQLALSTAKSSQQQANSAFCMCGLLVKRVLLFIRYALYKFNADVSVLVRGNFALKYGLNIPATLVVSQPILWVHRL